MSDDDLDAVPTDRLAEAFRETERAQHKLETVTEILSEAGLDGSDEQHWADAADEELAELRAALLGALNRRDDEEAEP